METAYSDKIFKPVREPSAWLALLLIRLIIGSGRGILSIVSIMPMIAQSLQSSPSGPLLVIAFVLYACIVGLMIADLVLYFYKSKKFIPMYIVTVGILFAVYFIGKQYEYACIAVIIESFFIPYLLTSKKAALRFGYFNKFNRAALTAYAIRADIGEEKEAVILEIEKADSRCRRNEISREEFSEIKRGLLAKL